MNFPSKSKNLAPIIAVLAADTAVYRIFYDFYDGEPFAGPGGGFLIVSRETSFLLRFAVFGQKRLFTRSSWL